MSEHPSKRLAVLFLALTAALPAALSGALSAQEHAAPPKQDPAVTIEAVADLLENRHLSGEPLDDLIARRAFEVMIRAFDPLGLYLLQGDVDQLAMDATRIDDQVRAGDDEFARRLQQVLQQRVPAAIELALAWLDKPHDFAVDETMRVDIGPDEHAKTRDELDDRWRRRVKYDLLVLEGDGIRGAEAKERLRKRYERMAERATLRTPQEVDNTLLAAIASSYDPHTVYMPPRAAENFAIHMRLQYEGIGAVLGDEEGRAVVRELIRGGAAAKGGDLKVGDVIQGVGEGEGAIVPVQGLDLDDVVDKIRGPHDTVVRLSVTTGAAPARTVEIHRAKTELVDDRASGHVVEQDGSRVGWIDLPGFYGAENGPTASGDVADILRDFAASKVDAVVLDLSRNGGGYLHEAVDLTGLFIDRGNVVQVRGASGDIRPYDDEEPGALWTGPLVVLVSRFSASASEIVAGAIVDQGRGIVVGDTATHGKGTVQTILDLARVTHRKGAAGAVKLTIQQFFRPGGDSTQLHGVPSDVVLPSFTEALGEGEAALPNALPFARIPAVAKVESKARDAEILGRLGKASAQRCAEVPEFQHVVDTNKQRRAWAEAKVVPLQSDAFATWRDVGKKQQHDDDKGLAPWYAAEVTRVARDYALELRGRRAI